MRAQEEKNCTFPSTRWSVVARSTAEETGIRLTAMDDLLRVYRPVLIRWLVGAWRFTPDQAEDHVQSFVAEKILQQQLLKSADRNRGKFRSFLLKSFSNYLKSRLRKEQAAKRQPEGGRLLSLDEMPNMPAPRMLSTEFNLSWARQVLGLALDQMKKECEGKGRPDVWGIFEDRLLNPILENSAPSDYEQLVETYRLASPSQAANLLITAKRMFHRALENVVQDTVDEGRDVAGEIRELKKILSASHAGFAR